MTECHNGQHQSSFDCFSVAIIELIQNTVSSVSHLSVSQHNRSIYQDSQSREPWAEAAVGSIRKASTCHSRSNLNKIDYFIRISCDWSDCETFMSDLMNTQCPILSLVHSSDCSSSFSLSRSPSIYLLTYQTILYRFVYTQMAHRAMERSQSVG